MLALPMCTAQAQLRPGALFFPPPLPRQVLRVPVDEFKRLMLGGDMLLPSITTGFMALERLQQEGLL